jgi:hypothetical protein
MATPLNHLAAAARAAEMRCLAECARLARCARTARQNDRQRAARAATRTPYMQLRRWLGRRSREEAPERPIIALKNTYDPTNGVPVNRDADPAPGTNG